MSIFKLIWMQLKVAYGLSVMRWYMVHNRLKFLGNLGLATLVLVSLAPIFYIYLRVLDGLYLGAAMFGQGQAVIATGLVGGSLIVFLFGIAYVMSTFYFSRDLNFLLALPIQPASVMAAKFSVVLISNYITLIPFVLPALYVYGFYNGFTIVYLLMSFMVFLLTPLIPLALASICVMLLMRFTNLSRRRDTVRLAGMIFFLFMIVFLNIFLTQIPEGSEAEYIQNILMNSEGLVGLMVRIFPPALLATRALVSSGSQAFLNLVYFTAASIVATLLAVWTGGRIFYQGLIGGSEVIARKSMTREALKSQFDRGHSPTWAIALREIKSLLRTPIYFFNSVAIIILLPVMMIVPLVVSGGSSQIIQALAMIESRFLILLLLAAFIGGTAVFAPAASSSFSREGRTFWISKVIPVEPLTQIHGKILYSLLISLLGVPLVLIAVIWLIPVSIGEFLLIVGMGCAISFSAITSNLFVDFLRPYLTWDDPQRAIKQNMNVLVGMVISGSFIYIIYLVARFTMQTESGSGITAAAVVLTSLFLGLIPYALMRKMANGHFTRIEI
jgi:ABC-2 type transport system permease protein